MRLNIRALGPGCPNCHRVEENAVEALERLSEEKAELEAVLEHVTQRGKIMEYSIVTTPGLVVNGELVCAGRIRMVEEAGGWLEQALDGRSELRTQPVRTRDKASLRRSRSR